MKFNYTFEKKQMLCTLWAVLASLLLPLGAWAEIEPKEPAYEDGYYQIYDASELIWFRNEVNHGNTTINGKLFADIDLTDIDFKGIGDADHTFSGHFDGQLHHIKNMILEGNYRGFIGHVGNGFAIEGVIIDKTCRVISTTNQVGGVVGYCPDATYRISIKNCGNEAPVSGVYHVGGIFGGIRGNVNVSYNNVTISNCYNTGTITTTGENGYAIAGYVGSGKAIIENCWNSGEIITKKTNGTTYFTRYSKELIFTNNYGLGDTSNKVADTNQRDSGKKATSFTAEELANGALTYKMNGGKTDGTQVWYQKIGVDEHPVFAKGNTVYCINDLACDGKTTKGNHYSNDANDPRKVADHDEAKEGDDDTYDIVCQNCKATLGKCFHYDDSENTLTVTKNQEGAWYADSEIHLSDSYDYTSPVAFIARSVTYTRKMSDNYGSLILPFEAKSDDKVTLYSLAEVNNDNVTFQKAETIAAGTPCIFLATKGEDAVITGENVTLSAMAQPQVDGEPGDMQMHGTYQKLTGQMDLWFLAKDKLYYSSTAPVTLLPFRSWLTSTTTGASSMRNIIIEDEGMTTAIECINNQAESTASCTYDLQGRLVKNQKSGFMIQNGKEVLVGSK